MNLYGHHQKVAELRRNGQRLAGTVQSANVSISRSSRRTYSQHDVLILHTTLDGQPFDTPLDEARIVIDEVRPGQPLEAVYLAADKQRATDGHLYFFDDHCPVPLAYVQQNVLTSSYAWLVYGVCFGSIGTLLATRRRRVAVPS